MKLEDKISVASLLDSKNNSLAMAAVSLLDENELDGGESLSQLVKHKNHLVRNLVAQRVRIVYLPLMLDDEDSSVRLVVAQRIDPLYLGRLTSDKSSVVASVAKSRIERLANSMEPYASSRNLDRLVLQEQQVQSISDCSFKPTQPGVYVEITNERHYVKPKSAAEEIREAEDANIINIMRQTLLPARSSYVASEPRLVGSIPVRQEIPVDKNGDIFTQDLFARAVAENKLIVANIKRQRQLEKEMVVTVKTINVGSGGGGGYTAGGAVTIGGINTAIGGAGGTAMSPVANTRGSEKIIWSGITTADPALYTDDVGNYPVVQQNALPCGSSVPTIYSSNPLGIPTGQGYPGWFGPYPDNSPETIKPTFNHTCTGCNTHNEYAEANQADGTYLCYDCRNKGQK